MFEDFLNIRKLIGDTFKSTISHRATGRIILQNTIFWMPRAPKYGILESMAYLSRRIENNITTAVQRGKSVLLLGARQTGKTTLLEQLKSDLTISFAPPHVRQRFEKDIALLHGEIEALSESSKLTKSRESSPPLIIIDEVQKIPDVLDLAQDFIDRKKAQFILTGSSARKIKAPSSINLLPGRVISLKLTPLNITELPQEKLVLEDLLMYGSLPGIVTQELSENKEQDLISYTEIYLDQEIRAEALVRNVGLFAKFLELAAAESGQIVNFRKLSQQIGIAHTTIAAYYQILEDCLVVERIEPFVETKTRRRLLQSPKYLFFDLGVRRVSANEGIKPPIQYFGTLFEQFIGLELLRLVSLMNKRGKICFWRDAYGTEVDWIISHQEQLVPIEVKLTATPSVRDTKHLQTFLSEYENVVNAYIVCTTPRKLKLAERIYAIPWQELWQELESLL